MTTSIFLSSRALQEHNMAETPDEVLVEVHEFDSRDERDGFFNGRLIGEPVSTLEDFYTTLSKTHSDLWKGFKIDGVIVNYDDVMEHFGVPPNDGTY